MGKWQLSLCKTLIVCLPVLAFFLGLSRATADSAAVVNDASLPAFENPLIRQRADPWIYRHSDGYYYFIATAPEFDRIEIRKARKLADLKKAKATVVWHAHESPPMVPPIWAPELHYIDGAWYIYFAANTVADRWEIRMHVMKNISADPTQGQWQELGRVMSSWDSFSLDATTFAHKGKRYQVWAQRDRQGRYNSALYIAQMSSPNTLDGPEVMLTEPVLPWEVIGFKVNEGPAVLIRNNKIFITYSASATDANYAMGLLWADADANLLDPSSWHKSPMPVFTTNAQVNRFGPGHNSFTVADDGETDLMIYHARDYKDIDGDPLFDHNRHTRVRVLGWTEDGFPDFRPEMGD